MQIFEYCLPMSIVCTRKSHVCNLYDTHMYAHVTRISLVCALILSICTRLPFAYHSHILVCHLYITRIFSYVIVCHSYVFVCHPYVTRMYSYVIRASLVCTHMWPVCHSHILVCHPCATCMYSYVIRMSIVCGFSMNQLSIGRA